MRNNQKHGRGNEGQVIQRRGDICSLQPRFIKAGTQSNGLPWNKSEQA
jgi:hypothetical protein